MHTALWRRLDRAGQDARRFRETVGGWVIEGAAVFDRAGGVADPGHRLICDGRWSSLRASVAGWVGPPWIELRPERGDAGGWRVNGAAAEALPA